MMSPQVPRQRGMLVLWLILVMIVSGCSGQRIVTSAGDQTFQAGPPPTVEATEVVPQRGRKSRSCALRKSLLRRFRKHR